MRDDKVYCNGWVLPINLVIYSLADVALCCFKGYFDTVVFMQNLNRVLVLDLMIEVKS